VFLVLKRDTNTTKRTGKSQKTRWERKTLKDNETFKNTKTDKAEKNLLEEDLFETEDPDALPDDTHRRRLVKMVGLFVAGVMLLGVGAPLIGVITDRIGERNISAIMPEQVEVYRINTTTCRGEQQQGSGFLVDYNNEIFLLTNRHVVQDAHSIGVRNLRSGEVVQIEKIWLSTTHDVAVLEADTHWREAENIIGLAPGRIIEGLEVSVIGYEQGRASRVDTTVSGTQDNNQIILTQDTIRPGGSGSIVLVEHSATGQVAVAGQMFASSPEHGVANSNETLMFALENAETDTIPGC